MTRSHASSTMRSVSRAGLAATLTASLALATTAAAQEPTPLLLVGQPVPGAGGKVTGIEAVHVASNGDRVVEITTDVPEHPEAVLVHSAWLQSWFVWKQVGDTLNHHPGATVAEVGGVTSDVLGVTFATGRLAGTAGGSSDDEVVFFQGNVLFQEGTAMPGDVGTFRAFGKVDGATNSGVSAYWGHMDDPTIAGPDETYMMMAGMAGSVGAWYAQDRIVWDGQPAPGLPETISSIRVTPAQGAISPSGLRVVWSCDLRGDPDTDGCVYLYAYNGDHELLAREGATSPVPGRRWGPLENIGVDVNSVGTWTLRARLDDSAPAHGTVLVKDDQVIALQGESLPSVAPDVITAFGRGPGLIDEAGRVGWYARLSGPGGESEAIFRDDQLLVRTGVTLVGGRTLVDLGPAVEDLSLSPSGDLLLFTGTLAGGKTGAFALPL